jgi:hypothetical protein
MSGDFLRPVLAPWVGLPLDLRSAALLTVYGLVWVRFVLG